MSVAKISDDFEGTVFVPGFGSFAAGDELPAGAKVGDHIPVGSAKAEPAEKRGRRKADDSED